MSATDDQGAKHTLEKIAHASDPGDNGIILAYSKVKKDYRTYKLVRMSDLKTDRRVSKW